MSDYKKDIPEVLEIMEEYVGPITHSEPVPESSFEHYRGVLPDALLAQEKKIRTPSDDPNRTLVHFSPAATKKNSTSKTKTTNPCSPGAAKAWPAGARRGLWF